MTTPAITDEKTSDLTREQSRRETSLSLASDLIERGLQSTLADMHLLLIQIADSELIPLDDDLRRSLDRHCATGDRLLSQVVKIFPTSSHGGAAKLRCAKCRTLAQEVDFYRQEQFWTRADRESFLKSEDLITALFRFYADVEFLLLQIDVDQPDYRIERRVRAPQRTPNPYEDIFGGNPTPKQ